MATGRFNALTQELLRLASEDSLAWGNLASLRNSNIEDYGVEGALVRQKMREASPRRASSGMTSEALQQMFTAGKTRKERNAWRREHYRRKASLETKKEAERYASWRRRHPNEAQANWERRERNRQSRRAEERASRKTRRRSSGKP